MPSPPIIVLGAGVSGLSCAMELALAGRRVEIWAAKRPERSTSKVAAAFWYPYRAEPADRVGAWAAVSYERFASMAADLTLGPRAGVSMVEAIELLRTPIPDPPWSRGVDLFRHAFPDELPPGYVHGFVFEAPVIEMPRYLAWMVERLRTAFGVEIVERRLDSLGPALAAGGAVVNTTGLGARELVGDPRVFAVRGQVVHCERGGVDRVTIDEQGEDITYIVPRSGDVVLGGVADEHVERLEVDEAQTRAIIERCAALEPRLGQAELLSVEVGLRPCRDLVRVEREEIEGTPVIHNYGHGGSGVTLSWGCAVEVMKLLS